MAIYILSFDPTYTSVDEIRSLGYIRSPFLAGGRLRPSVGSFILLRNALTDSFVSVARSTGVVISHRFVSGTWLLELPLQLVVRTVRAPGHVAGLGLKVGTLAVIPKGLFGEMPTIVKIPAKSADDIVNCWWGIPAYFSECRE